MPVCFAWRNVPRGDESCPSSLAQMEALYEFCSVHGIFGVGEEAIDSSGRRREDLCTQ